MWQLVQSFYSGLDEHNKQMVNASCDGSFLYKTPEEAWELFEHLSENSHLHATSSHSNMPRQLGSKGGGGSMRFHIQLTFRIKLMLSLINLISCCA